MAEGVAANRFGNARELNSVSNGALKDEFVQVVPTLFAGTGVFGETTGRKGVLPSPFAGGARVFAFERFGKINFAKAIGTVHFVENLHADEMFLELGFNGGRQHGHAVFVAFAVANNDLVQFKIDVLHAQAETLQQAKTCSVEKFGQKLVSARHGGDHAGGLPRAT
jgi:hypothetical protein